MQKATHRLGVAGDVEAQVALVQLQASAGDARQLVLGGPALQERERGAGRRARPAVARRSEHVRRSARAGKTLAGAAAACRRRRTPGEREGDGAQKLTQAASPARGEQRRRRRRSCGTEAARARRGAERGGRRSGSRKVRDRHGKAEGRRPSRREHAVLRSGHSQGQRTPGRLGLVHCWPLLAPNAAPRRCGAADAGGLCRARCRGRHVRVAHLAQHKGGVLGGDVQGLDFRRAAAAAAPAARRRPAAAATARLARRGRVLALRRRRPAAHWRPAGAPPRGIGVAHVSVVTTGAARRSAGAAAQRRAEHAARSAARQPRRERELPKLPARPMTRNAPLSRQPRRAAARAAPHDVGGGARAEDTLLDGAGFEVGRVTT